MKSAGLSNPELDRGLFIEASLSPRNDARAAFDRGSAVAYTTAMKAYQEFDINYFQDEDGIFTATVPAIRGCVASGRTLDKAYRNAIDAIESCLEARRKVPALH